MDPPYACGAHALCACPAVPPAGAQGRGPEGNTATVLLSMVLAAGGATTPVQPGWAALDSSAPDGVYSPYAHVSFRCPGAKVRATPPMTQ